MSFSKIVRAEKQRLVDEIIIDLSSSGMTREEMKAEVARIILEKTPFISAEDMDSLLRHNALGAVYRILASDFFFAKSFPVKLESGE